MRASTIVLPLFIALIGPVAADEPSHHLARKRTVHSAADAGKPSDLLPVSGPKPPVIEADHGPADKALHFGTVTLTPGGFLDVGTRGSSGRD